MRNEELILLPRWGEFLLCAALPRAVPTADGFLPFQGVGGCAAGRLGMCIALIVSALNCSQSERSDCKSDRAGTILYFLNSMHSQLEFSHFNYSKIKYFRGYCIDLKAINCSLYLTKYISIHIPKSSLLL